MDLGNRFLFVDATEVSLRGVSVRWTSVIGFFLLTPLKFVYLMFLVVEHSCCIYRLEAT